MKAKSNSKTPIDWKYYISIGGKLLLIASLTAALLALVNMLTFDRIADNESKVIDDAISSIFTSPDKIKKNNGVYESPVVAVYKVYSDGELKGYCVQVEPMGFKDKITMLVGADIYGNCIGVEITSLSDTPGVGTKAKDSGYLDGFKGYDIKNIAEYDTITGATISSTAVKDGVKAALSLGIYKEEKDKRPDKSPDYYDEDNDYSEKPNDSESTDVGEETEERKFERFETQLGLNPVKRPWMTEAPETTLKPGTDTKAPTDMTTAPPDSESKPVSTDTTAPQSDSSTTESKPQESSSETPESSAETGEEQKNAIAPSEAV